MDFNALSLPSGLHVRPSTSGDQPFLELLYKSTRTDLDLLTADKDFIEELKSSQFAAQTASYEEQFPNAMHFVIEQHHQKVGRVILDFGNTEVLVVDISFIPEARGKGLGSGVMRSFMHVSDQIRTPLKLSVLQENVTAKAFYSQLGFIHDEHRYPRDYLVYYPSSQASRVTA